jgi:pyruvate dehydrogenase E1 component
VATTIPNCRVYDPAFAYETAIVIRDGMRAMLEAGEDVFYYLALYNENHAMPALPAGVTDSDVVRGLYRFGTAPAVEVKRGPALAATLLGSGSIMQQVLRAQALLAERFGVAAEVWSVPSYQQLRADALEVERWNRLHPAEPARVPLVASALADAAARGPIVAATDFVKTVPDQVARWVPGGSFVSLGTDGFGRSDTREALRRLFGNDAESIAAAVMAELARSGRIEPAAASAAIAELGLDPEARNPLQL